MKTYLIYSNDVFIHRVNELTDPNKYAKDFALINGYRPGDFEVFEADGDLVESAILTQQTGDVVTFKNKIVELIRHQTEVIEKEIEIIVEKDKTKKIKTYDHVITTTVLMSVPLTKIIDKNKL